MSVAAAPSRPALAGRVGDLALVPLGRHRADEHDRAPGFSSSGSQRPMPLPPPLLGDVGHHLQRPVDRRDQVDLDHLAKRLEAVDQRLAGLLVDLDRQGVAGDAGRGDADVDDPVSGHVTWS